MAEQTNNETRDLIVDSATRIFADRCDKPLLDAAEGGEFAEDLWALVRENGFDQLGSTGSGTDSADLHAFLRVCGRFAVPLPIADTLIANRWLGGAGISSVGLLDGDQVAEAVWGRRADRVLGVSPGGRSVSYGPAEVIEERRNLAGEPADLMRLVEVETIDLEHSAYAELALSRVSLMAGSLTAQLELGITYASERLQFGRPISKFQAIQHSLAIVAAEVAAASRAADAAVDALGDERFECEVAAAKARVGEAVGIVAEQVHQVHGAMGYTHEHRLHHFSRRAWAWRDAFGNEFEWLGLLGRHLASIGADGVWDYIATRG